VVPPAELEQVQQLRGQLARLQAVGCAVDADLCSISIPTGPDGPDHLPLARLAASKEVISQRQQQSDEFAAQEERALVMQGLDGSMYCIRTPDDVARAEGRALYEAARAARHAYFGVPYPPTPPQITKAAELLLQVPHSFRCLAIPDTTPAHISNR